MLISIYHIGLFGQTFSGEYLYKYKLSDSDFGCEVVLRLDPKYDTEPYMYCKPINAIIQEYEERNLPVIRNLFIYSSIVFNNCGISLTDFLNRCKLIPSFSKYENDMQKYLILAGQ